MSYADGFEAGRKDERERIERVLRRIGQKRSRHRVHKREVWCLECFAADLCRTLAEEVACAAESEREK